jgi:transposase
MGYWSKAELDRDQMVLISTTLSDRIPEDHSVRLFWELLETYDWSGWESHYCGCHGQPPIHPRIVAGVLLYGLTQGIRSSRRLEWACGHALDFMWLSEGRLIDHSTLCEFRVRFGGELKALFRHLGRLALSMGVVRLNHVAIDGTRVGASSSRHGTRGIKSIEEELSCLDERLESMLAEAEQVDRRESANLFGEDASPVTSVGSELASLESRQKKLKKALSQLKGRQASGSSQKKVAMSDPEAPILPNKDGGFRPNYTPVVATDSAHRYVLAETVQSDEGEREALMPLLDEVREGYGRDPQTGSADSTYSTPENLQAVDEHPTDMYIAPWGERLEGDCQTTRGGTHMVDQDDPRQPVPQERWKELPRTKRGRIAQEAFIYDASSDCYWCPMGRRLPLRRVDRERCDGREKQRRVYICASCTGCPLRMACAGRRRYRRVRARSVEPWREKMAAKVHSQVGRAVYGQRRYVGESPFGVIKTVMGVRQFLLRGCKRVQTEWRWVCTAYDLRILMKWVAVQRHKVATA